MVCTGVYVYYGFKITDKNIKQFFENNNFKKYCQENYKKRNKAIRRYIYEFCQFDFENYINDLIQQKKYEYEITCTTLPCCAYKNSYWIIGVKICYMDGFNFKQTDDRIFASLDQYFNVLNQMRNDLNLNNLTENILPGLFNIANDCTKCT